MGEGAAHKDHSREGKIARRGRVVRVTATVTATAAANGYQQRPATTHKARTIRANLAYARPEKRTVEDQSAPGSHAGSYRDEQPSDIPDSHGQRAVTGPRQRTDLNGAGCRYRNLRIRRLGFESAAQRSASPTPARQVHAHERMT
jgi:hypothetical protein